MSEITKTEPMVLANIGGGRLEDEFQHCLAEVQEILADPDRYQKSAGQLLKAVIKIEVEVGLLVDSGIRTVSHQVELRRPKTLEREEQCFLQDGVFLVQPHIDQPNLFALRKPGEKGA